MTKLRLTVAALFVIALLAIAAVPAVATASRPHHVYAFALTSWNTALATGSDTMTSPGDTISVKGAGVFDTAAGTVTAGGKFVHYAADGTVHCQGTWKATSFTSFVDLGAGRFGQQGGVLSLVVSHDCATMGMTMSDIPMTITAASLAPAGAVEGVTVGPFTVPLKGAVVMVPLK
jgi:hypothetical protein